MEEKEKKQEEIKKSTEGTNNTVKETKSTEKKTNAKKNDTSKQEVKKEGDKKKENSKVKGKVTVEGKKSKKAPIITAIVIIAIIILAIVLYVVFANGPKGVVEGLFTALKNGDYDKVNEYINYNEVISSSDILDSESLDEETMNLLFEKLSWKITETTKEENTASVTVEVTNKNFRTIIANYMQNALRVAFSGQELSDAEMENYLLEELRNEDVETTTTTQTINLTKQDGKWVINTTDTNLIDILLPGLNEAVNSLS